MGMHWRGRCLAGGLALVSSSLLAQVEMPSVAQHAPDLDAAASAPSGDGIALTRADVDAWLDGFVPYALARGDVAGAVVVVVKDGEILTRRGYGHADVATRRPVDPESTLFRPGSVSKLITWTAVMQQVERGTIDLDADLNRYLDFEIPAHEGEPITMRQVMRHTAGFEESIRGLIVFEPPIASLAETLQRWIPTRIHAPDTTPAYSNYATTLAGYVVERVSGQSFDDYVEEHIFAPAGMTTASFRQPLPDDLVPLMSTGYALGSGEPKDYELIPMAPAGSMAASGIDMARFMLAHLDQGGPLLRPETARQMHAPGPVFIPGINQMALGFYEQWINGRRAIGHGGDTFWFHSYLWLFPEENVGLFVSMNSAGREGVTNVIRGALFEQFANRYFPAPDPTPPTELDSAAEHARMLAGTYWSSRRADTSFLRILQLMSQFKVGLDTEGRPLVSVFTRPGGAARSWIEVEPFVWRDAHGYARLAATVEDGRALRWSFDDLSPFMVFDRVPWYLDSAWLMPSLVASLVVLGLTALSWPVAALVRRRYRQPLALAGGERTSYRAVRGAAWFMLAIFVGWGLLVSTVMSSFDKHGGLDGFIWILQLLGPLGFIALLGATGWNLVSVWTHPRGAIAKGWSVLLLLASLLCLWVAVGFNLIGFGTDF